MENRPFSTRLTFEQEIGRCLARANQRLDLFDPDFSLWQLGSSRFDAELRRFLAGKGQIRMLAHDYDHLKHRCPRFVRLLRDFSHVIECRVTHPNERHLTDSFCIADDLHLVRRFHCDHARGVAAFDAAPEAIMCGKRFSEVWQRAADGMQIGTTGL
jgi:hypothetical protein